MPGIGIGISPSLRRGSGTSWSSYWASLISATVENAAPTDIVMTFPSPAAITAANLSVAGFTISSASWTGNVLTVVLTEAVLVFDGNLTITFVTTGQTATVINNVADDGNTVAWYDFTDASTLTDDGGGLISQWRDKLGSGHDLIASGTERPTLTVDGVDFNGSTNVMATNGFTYNQPEMVYLTVLRDVFVANDKYFDGLNYASGCLACRGDAPTIQLLVSTYGPNNTNHANDTWGIIRALFNGANSTLQVDETAIKTGSLPNIGMGGITIGASGYLGGNHLGFLDGTFKELIFRKSADTTEVQLAIYNYLKKKSKLTLVDIYSHNVPSYIYIL